MTGRSRTRRVTPKRSPPGTDEVSEPAAAATNETPADAEPSDPPPAVAATTTLLYSRRSTRIRGRKNRAMEAALASSAEATAETVKAATNTTAEATTEATAAAATEAATSTVAQGTHKPSRRRKPENNTAASGAETSCDGGVHDIEQEEDEPEVESKAEESDNDVEKHSDNDNEDYSTTEEDEEDDLPLNILARKRKRRSLTPVETKGDGEVDGDDPEEPSRKRALESNDEKNDYVGDDEDDADKEPPRKRVTRRRKYDKDSSRASEDSTVDEKEEDGVDKVGIAKEEGNGSHDNDEKHAAPKFVDKLYKETKKESETTKTANTGESSNERESLSENMMADVWGNSVKIRLDHDQSNGNLEHQRSDVALESQSIAVENKTNHEIESSAKGNDDSKKRGGSGGDAYQQSGSGDTLLADMESGLRVANITSKSGDSAEHESMNFEIQASLDASESNPAVGDSKSDRNDTDSVERTKQLGEKNDNEEVSSTEVERGPDTKPLVEKELNDKDNSAERTENPERISGNPQASDASQPGSTRDRDGANDTKVDEALDGEAGGDVITTEVATGSDAIPAPEQKRLDKSEIFGVSGTGDGIHGEGHASSIRNESSALESASSAEVENNDTPNEVDGGEESAKPLAAPVMVSMHEDSTAGEASLQVGENQGVSAGKSGSSPGEAKATLSGNGPLRDQSKEKTSEEAAIPDGQNKLEEEGLDRPQMLLSLERIKVTLFALGRRVHRNRGYERLFSDYWQALSMRLEGRMSPAVTQPGAAVARFLRTKTLRRLHNRLIMGLLERCMTPTIPSRSINTDELPGSIKARTRPYLVEKEPKPLSCVEQRDQRDQPRMLPSYAPILSAREFAQNTQARPSTSSVAIPGAIVVDPFVRKLAQAAGMHVSENAIWLLVVAMKEYAAAVLKGAIETVRSLEAGEVPPQSLIRPQVLGRRKAASSKSKKAETYNSVTEQKCITALDIHALTATMPLGPPRSLGGCASRITFETGLFASADYSVVGGGKAYTDVKSFIFSAIAPPLPKQQEVGDLDRNDAARERSTITTAEAPVPQTQAIKVAEAPVSETKNTPAVQSANAATSASIAQRKVVARSHSGGLGRGAKDLASLKARSALAATNTEANSSDPGGAGVGLPKGKDSSTTTADMEAGPTLPVSVPASPAQQIAMPRKGKGFGVKNLAAMLARSREDHKVEGGEGKSPSTAPIPLEPPGAAASSKSDEGNTGLSNHTGIEPSQAPAGSSETVESRTSVPPHSPGSILSPAKSDAQGVNAHEQDRKAYVQQQLSEADGSATFSTQASTLPPPANQKLVQEAPPMEQSSEIPPATPNKPFPSSASPIENIDNSPKTKQVGASVTVPVDRETKTQESRTDDLSSTKTDERKGEIVSQEAAPAAPENASATHPTSITGSSSPMDVDGEGNSKEPGATSQNEKSVVEMGHIVANGDTSGGSQKQEASATPGAA